MRNDARDDDLDHIPGLTADPRDFDDFPPAKREKERERVAAAQRGFPPPSKSASTGPLWALVGALCIALGGLGWWSFQQISLMEQQLVATQESFGRISEEAAHRLQDITGKVANTESTANSGTEALRLQVRQLETKLLDENKQDQTFIGQQSDQDKRLTQLTTQLTEQQAATLQAQAALTQMQTANSQLQERLKAITADQATLKSGQVDQGKLDAQLKSLNTDIAQLKKQGSQSAAIESLQQDVLVLKSQLENRQNNSSSTAEFDAFRGQMTRNINTLNSQVQNLQQQLNAHK